MSLRPILISLCNVYIGSDFAIKIVYGVSSIKNGVIILMVLRRSSKIFLFCDLVNFRLQVVGGGRVIHNLFMRATFFKCALMIMHSLVKLSGSFFSPRCSHTWELAPAFGA
jgi:hypothetical protein